MRGLVFRLDPTSGILKPRVEVTSSFSSFEDLSTSTTMFQASCEWLQVVDSFRTHRLPGKGGRRQEKGSVGR